MAEETLDKAKKMLDKAENKFTEFSELLNELNKNEFKNLLIYSYKLLVLHKKINVPPK